MSDPVPSKEWDGPREGQAYVLWLEQQLVELRLDYINRALPCKGKNCGSTDPRLHSADCFEEYERSSGAAQPPRAE